MIDDELISLPPVSVADVIAPDAVPLERRRARFYEQIEHSHQPRRRARKYKAEGTHGWRDVLRKWDDQEGCCALCGRSLDGGFHVDHIMPLSKGGSDWPENIQLTCPPCNISKGARISYPVRLGSKKP